MSTTTAEKPKAALPRLKQRYREDIVGQLREEFGYPNVMQVPGLVKVVVNMGVGDAAKDSKLMDGALRDLARRPDVGVRGPAALAGAAPYP
jgi:large subunit ribosomal protein L5